MRTFDYAFFAFAFFLDALWFWRESIDDDDLRPRVAAFRKKAERLFCIVRHKRNFVTMSGGYGDWECVRCPARGIDRLV